MKYRNSFLLIKSVLCFEHLIDLALHDFFCSIYRCRLLGLLICICGLLASTSFDLLRNFKLDKAWDGLDPNFTFTRLALPLVGGESIFVGLQVVGDLQPSGSRTH